MWEKNIEIQIYNLFAEIYLFLDNIDTVKKNLLEDNYDFVQLSEKYHDIKIELIQEELSLLKTKNDYSKTDLQYLLEILLVIDYNFIKDLNNSFTVFSKPLNTYKTEKIVLFPKFNNNIERRSGTNNIFSSKFKNILPIIFPSQNKYNIINHYIRNYNENKELFIAAIPMFSENENLKFINSLKMALDDGANVVISNEYSGSALLDDEIYDTIINYPNIYFVCSPSYKNNNSNLTKIFYKGNNRILETEYKKHNPYTEKGKLKEDIEYQNPTFHLFHIRGVGMFSIIICKDFFSQQTEDFINQTQLDGIFIIAMTPNYSSFSSKASSFVMHKRVLLLCNKCKTCEENQLPSPIFYSYYDKKDKVNKNEITSYIKIKCKYSCVTNYCYFLIKLNNNNQKLIMKDFEHKVG